MNHADRSLFQASIFGMDYLTHGFNCNTQSLAQWLFIPPASHPQRVTESFLQLAIQHSVTAVHGKPALRLSSRVRSRVQLRHMSEAIFSPIVFNSPLYLRQPELSLNIHAASGGEVPMCLTFNINYGLGIHCV